MSELPGWQGFIIPILSVLGDGVGRAPREIRRLIASQLKLTDEQVRQTYTSGTPIFQGRVTYCIDLLLKVGALGKPAPATYVITEAGQEVLDHFPDGVTAIELKELADQPTSLLKGRVPAGGFTIRLNSPSEDNKMTPTEQVEAGIGQIEQEVAEELLVRLQDQEPAFFEEAVVKLLLAMGYGGTEGTGVVTPLSGDGGIDGVIDQDVLGLSRVYIQAKRYGPGNVVGRPDIQAFVGALSGKADRGVFITTSRFSADAHQYAENVPTRIILIDGDRLTRLMIRYNVGVQVKDTYNVVEIDEDFFE